mmetsp:Transcript_82300/g.233101  ORF Transcript_82300/g.233101 Transcript_82300/m.233101 type:complete len:330 (+) Transcript_82300:96-1085(+)
METLIVYCEGFCPKSVAKNFEIGLVALMSFILPIAFWTNLWEAQVSYAGCMAFPTHAIFTIGVVYIGILFSLCTKLGSRLIDEWKEDEFPNKARQKFLAQFPRVPIFFCLFLCLTSCFMIPLNQVRSRCASLDSDDMCADFGLRSATRGLFTFMYGVASLFLLDMFNGSSMEWYQTVHHLNSLVGGNICLWQYSRNPAAAYLYLGDAFSVAGEWILFALGAGYHWNTSNPNVQANCDLGSVVFEIVAQLARMIWPYAYIAEFHNCIPVHTIIGWSISHFVQSVLAVIFIRYFLSRYRTKRREADNQKASVSDASSNPMPATLGSGTPTA